MKSDKIDVQKSGNLWYTSAVRKRTNEKRDQTVTVKTTATIKNALEGIATTHDRTVSKIAELLIARGLSAYHRDGFLLESESATVPVVEANVGDKEKDAHETDQSQRRSRRNVR